MVQNKENPDRKHLDTKKDQSEKHIVHKHNKKQGKSATRRNDPSGLPKYR